MASALLKMPSACVQTLDFELTSFLNISRCVLVEADDGIPFVYYVMTLSLLFSNVLNQVFDQEQFKECFFLCFNVTAYFFSFIFNIEIMDDSLTKGMHSD